jgi:predicted TIM-barrel fold metal-dependent hydrolase
MRLNRAGLKVLCDMRLTRSKANSNLWPRIFNLFAAATIAVPTLDANQATSDVQRQAGTWRAEHRILDLHQHINGTTQHVSRAVKIMDAVGVGIGVNLSGGTVTRPKPDQPSEFERNKTLADNLFPGRFLQYMNLDYTGWDEPDFAERAVKQIEEGHRLGAAGFKEYKRLGLTIRDRAGKAVKIDDSKLDPMWKRLGELNMPVSIHVADPKAFWEPYNPQNERWKELGDHPNWWFGDPKKFPPRMELLEALDRVIARHPKTKFVCVHFANNAEDLDWVEKALDRRQNMFADLAARIPEIGRHDPEKVRRLFLKHQDRILFATDFQVYDKLILGSSGNEPPPTDADAEVFFAKEWRWLETRDRNWPHMTPIQGDWTISSIGLPSPVLRKVYFDNARKLLGRSLPLPLVRARHISQDFQPNGELDEPVWQMAKPVVMEYSSGDYSARPEMATTVRVLWSDDSLYLGYECPFTKFTVFDPPAFDKERHGQERGMSLWDRDVVEAFIASDPANLRHYSEYEVAPTNEKLDLVLDAGKGDFEWSSGFQSAVQIDKKAKRWTCEMRIPLKSLASVKPQAGTQWRLNFFRCDRANNAFLAWNPALTGSFHTPEKFGVLVFVE